MNHHSIRDYYGNIIGITPSSMIEEWLKANLDYTLEQGFAAGLSFVLVS